MFALFFFSHEMSFNRFYIESRAFDRRHRRPCWLVCLFKDLALFRSVIDAKAGFVSGNKEPVSLCEHTALRSGTLSACCTRNPF